MQTKKGVKKYIDFVDIFKGCPLIYTLHRRHFRSVIRVRDLHVQTWRGAQYSFLLVSSCSPVCESATDRDRQTRT